MPTINFQPLWTAMEIGATILGAVTSAIGRLDIAATAWAIAVYSFLHRR